jgi:hypothetical protein
VKAINCFLTWIERIDPAVPVVVEEIQRDGVTSSLEDWLCLRGSVQPPGISIWAYRGEELRISAKASRRFGSNRPSFR